MSERLAAQAGRLLVETDPGEDTLALDGAFAQFYTFAFPRVYGFVRSQVGDVTTAQEIVGRIFLKAYRHRRKAPAGEAALLWVFRIAHTTLIDYWRVERRREAVSVSLDEIADLPDGLADPEARYAMREREGLLLRVVGQLGVDDRSVLALKFIAQRTNREIAEILQLSEGAVSMRLLRALRRVRERLLEMGAA